MHETPVNPTPALFVPACEEEKSTASATVDAMVAGPGGCKDDANNAFRLR